MTNPLNALCCGLLCLPMVSLAGDSILSGDVNLRVTVLVPTCNISPDDQPLAVKFNPVSYRQFYEGIEPEKTFALHLTDCDTSVLKTVRFTFSGDEETSLPGLLAISPASTAQGIAIGIRDESGEDLFVNHQSAAYPLQDGDMTFNFTAYLKARPEAIEKKSLVAGEFSAQAVLNFNYE